MLGSIIGDTVGSRFQCFNNKSKDFKFLSKECFLTDDSYMTLAIMELMQNKKYDEDEIIDGLKKWGLAYPEVGYGANFRKWLTEYNPKPYNSYGNGAAMRIAPVGCYSRTIDECNRLAFGMTKVSHNHEEGLKAARIVAGCVFYAGIGKSKEYIKNYVEREYKFDFDYDDLVLNYKFDESSMGSVPQAIYCFLISNSFEDTIRTAISIGGDSDTIACIAGGIAEAYYKYIPAKIIKKMNQFILEERRECNTSLIINNYLKDKSYSLNKLDVLDDDVFILKREGKYLKGVELLYSWDKDILINYLYERIKELNGIELKDLVELRELKNKSLDEINRKLLELKKKGKLSENFYLYKNKKEYLNNEKK